MIYRVRSSHPSAPPGLSPAYWQTLLVLVLLAPWVWVAADLESAVVDSAEFNEAFDAYYDALDGYTPEDLRLELWETIEDALIAGSYMSRASLDYKTRQIETELFAQLRRLLCPGSFATNPTLDALKLAAVRSVEAAGHDAAVTFDPAELGMIASVVVRLVQGTPPARFCSPT